MLKVHVWRNSCHVRTGPNFWSPQVFKIPLFPNECSKWNWNPNFTQYDHDRVCNQVFLIPASGHGDGPQSLWHPPTGQDMPQALGMPHIYFPPLPISHPHTRFAQKHVSLMSPPGNRFSFRPDHTVRNLTGDPPPQGHCSTANDLHVTCFQSRGFWCWYLRLSLPHPKPLSAVSAGFRERDRRALAGERVRLPADQPEAVRPASGADGLGGTPGLLPLRPLPDWQWETELQVSTFSYAREGGGGRQGGSRARNLWLLVASISSMTLLWK